MGNVSTAGSPEAVDPQHFRTVLGHFCSGVVIVTSGEGETPVGMTAQSFSSLSLDPPLVLFCPSKTSTTWPRLRRHGRFLINVLGADQEQVSRGFAVSGGDKFAGVDWSWSDRGNPVVAGSLAYIECSLGQVHDAGDHEIVVGQVEQLWLGHPGEPLVFYKAEFRQLLTPPAES